MQQVAKLYIKMVDKTAVSTRKAFETVINEEETNKVTTNTNVQDLLTELKTLLEKADTKTTTTEDDEKHNKYHMRKNLLKILRNLYKIEDETTTPTEHDLNVRRAVDTAIEEFVKNVETFVERAIQTTEKYWHGLSTTEQDEKKKLHDIVLLVKIESCPRRQLEILEQLFEFNNTFMTNGIW